MGKLLILFAIVVFLGIGTVIVMVAVAGRDIPPPDTTDLIPERTELPPEQNGFTCFVSATSSFYWPADNPIVTDYLSGKPVDEGLVEEVIARNATTFQEIKRGLECGVCLMPEPTQVATPCPYFEPLRQIGRVMALKTKRDRLAGRYADATSTCISLLQFGDMIQKDAGSLIASLVGISVLAGGVEQAQDLACDKGTPPEELRWLADALARLGPFDRGFIHSIKVEYRVFANTIDQLGMDDLPGLADGRPIASMKGKRIPGYLFQRNRTKLAFAKYCREMILNASLCYADMKLSDVGQHRGSASTLSRIIRPNVIGRTLYELTSGLDFILEKKCMVECDVEAAHLLVACNAYQKKEGKLPESLQALVPTYIAAIPTDPYDGKSFRYSPSLGIVYSVGKDLKDSGGSTKIPAGVNANNASQKQWKAEDIVFQVSAPIEQPPAGALPKPVTQE